MTKDVHRARLAPAPRPASRNSVTCAAYADLLVDLSDGELQGADRERVLSHVGTCAVCQVELERLNQSLAILASGIVDVGGRCSRGAFAIPARHGSAGASPSQGRARWFTATALAAATALAVSLWPAPRPVARPKVAHVPMSNLPAPPAVISQADALRRIALLEQQARLQTSLDLMPQAAWYEEQREENHRLLDGFKAATGVSTHFESTGESL